MATDLNDLREALDAEVGLGKTNADLDRWLRLGVNLYSAHVQQAFALTGSTLDRDASDLEKRALVLFGVLAYLDQKVMEWSENAVIHSNVAGKVDLTGVEFALGKRRKELFEQQILPLIRRLVMPVVVADIQAYELSDPRIVVINDVVVVEE